jgi:DNA replication protein DnaC
VNDLKKQLLGIGLSATAAEIDDLLAHAINKRLGPAEILEKIIATESADRFRRSLERRMLRSRIGSFKPMADFDWNWPRKIDRPLIERALALDFLRDRRNLILLGPNGVGKTMITRNIAHAAVQAGHSVLFRTASELIDDVSRDSPELRRRRIALYTRPHLLCIDEVGYLSYDDHAADLLYKIINPRYEKGRSIIVSSNLAFKDWTTVFPNATCIVTLVDRLTHHADITVIEADSHRQRESQLQAAARGKPRKQ